ILDARLEEPEIEALEEGDEGEVAFAAVQRCRRFDLWHDPLVHDALLRRPRSGGHRAADGANPRGPAHPAPSAVGVRRAGREAAGSVRGAHRARTGVRARATACCEAQTITTRATAAAGAPTTARDRGRS